jgi:hypothetical protein
MGDTVTTGPDVRRLYAAAVKRLVAWRDTAPLLRRRSTERLREIVRQLENALLRRDAEIAAEGGTRRRSPHHLLDGAMLRSQSGTKRYLVGVSGQAVTGHGSFSAFDDSLRSLHLASAASPGGTSW